MRKKLRIAALICCGLLLLIAVATFVLYRASQQTPPFYREAMAATPAVQRKASDEMLQQATALASDVGQRGQWQALFTAEQINGWLAVDLIENHPNVLPKKLSDPRVAITRDRITVAGRLQRGNFTSVVSLTVEPLLPKPNVLGLRILGARAGSLPVPLGEILDRISAVAREANVDLRWQQVDGDPVLLISIAPPRKEGERSVRIEQLRVDQRGIFLSGSTEPFIGSSSTAQRQKKTASPGGSLQPESE